MIASWAAHEPTAGLLALLSAILFFRAGLTRPDRTAGRTWAGLGRFTGSLIGGLALLSWLILFYFFLSSNYAAFDRSARALDASAAAREKKEASQWRAMPISQGELDIRLSYVEHTLREIPRPDDQKPLYIGAQIVHDVLEDSIEGFTGRVDLQLLDSSTNRYLATADYVYHIVNPSDRAVTAAFDLPLTKGALYQDLQVSVDGKRIASGLGVENGILWSMELAAHQSLQVEISYTVRGRSSFDYQITGRRAIRNFSLTISADTLELGPYINPSDSGIESERVLSEDGRTVAYHWRIDRAILAPRIGIGFRNPSQTAPLAADQIRFLRGYPHAFALFLPLAALTILIFSLPLDLKRLALLAAAFGLPLLTLAGLGLLGVNLPIALLALWIPAGLIVYLIYRTLPRLPLGLILGLAISLGLLYQYAGLLTDERQRTTVEAFVQALIIVYLFLVTLHVRIRDA